MILLIFALTLANAQEKLSWRAAVDQTLKGNAEVAAAEASFRAATLDQKAAYSTYFPQLRGSLGYERGRVDTGNGLLSSRNSENYSATLSLTQNLFNGLRDQATVERAQASTEMMRARLESARAKAAYDLKQAYSALLFAQRGQELQNTIIRRREGNLRLVELRFKSGRENRGSVLLSQAYLQQARYDALQARHGAEVASSQLARVMGRDEDVLFQLEGDIPFRLPANQPDFRRLAESVPSQSEAVASVSSATAELKSARSGFFPILGLSASAGNLGDRWYPERDRWSVGATLTFPLFDGGRDYHGARAASEDLLAARRSLDNVTRELVASLRQAYTALIEANEKLKVDESFREAASKRAEIARVKYRNGLMTFEDWDLIESDLINREKAVLQSQRDRARAEAAWEQAQGKGLNLE